MDTLPLVTLMFILISSGALIWITIRAFKKAPGWGFAVLLLSPFSATAFGVRHWDEEREPFLLYITTFTASFALCAYLFAASGGLELLGVTNNMQRDIQTQGYAETGTGGFMRASYSAGETPAFTEKPLTEEISSALDMETSDEELAAMDDEPAAEEQKPLRHRLTYVPIKFSDVKNYIGTTAKITRKNVREREYLITGASPRHIELAQRTRGGKFSFHYKSTDIENIRVLINETY